MTRAHRYHLLSLFTCLGGLMILSTEVRERIGSMVALRSEIEVKEELTFGSLAEREQTLLVREKDLTSLLAGSGRETEQSEPGVIAFIHAAARRHRVNVESITPSAERKVDGHLAEIPIAISARGAFQDLGAFLGEMENGPFFFHIGKCEMTCDDAAGVGLLSRIETTAVIIGGGES